MPVVDIVALVIGVGLALAVAGLASGISDSTDESMRWEGGVAVGFTALIFLFPFWIAQLVLTVIATFDHRGIAPGWLWAWLFLPTALGLSKPGIALARLLKGLGPKHSAETHSDRTKPSDAASVQQVAQFAWADTQAGPGWELRRTPPLPTTWPPPPRGQAIWYCYAERDGTPAAIDVAAPWARISLSLGGQPALERLADAVEWLGPQAIQPLDPAVLNAPSSKTTSLIDAAYAGDPDGQLAQSLSAWRALNGCIANHPAVAPHLPPITLA